ncbi:FAD-binding oxidoreductase [Phyllobacterium sp. UNC302MFCol5.2]|uniref:FAD-binding oxidoreductase n=1 Tax=Phyllobacterium sp. UNC302MFCol5.2 TaxID=1449065 RepID=UPI00048200EC|nr:FAD-binding oxidoreductase [Phyllobacterium sp. UNC302MFCol5.2]
MTLLQTLTEQLGENKVSVGEQIPAKHFSDASLFPPTVPIALVRPSTTLDVSNILRLCNAARQPVVVQGGLTGLVGGAHPKGDEIAITMENMSAIGEIDVVNRTITVQAGATLAQVQEAASGVGFFYGVDLGARNSCTIGGNVATNAGGVQVLRYGTTRRHIAGVEAVLPDGTVISSMSKVMKNNTGYDWPQLMAGSEGTLAVITRVCLNLMVAPKPLLTALCAANSIEDALLVCRRLQEKFDGKLVTYEAMWRNYMEAGEHWGLLTAPFNTAPDITLLVEAALGMDEAARALFETTLFEMLEDGLLHDALIAQSESDRLRFWQLREANYEYYRHASKEIHYDIAVPLDRIAGFVDFAETSARQTLPGSRIVVYGHLGDGNLHVAIYPADAAQAIIPFETAFYDAVKACGGSVSAEHGIGVAKLKHLLHTRSEEELQLMRTIKTALDPHAILNRDRVFTAKPVL